MKHSHVWIVILNWNGGDETLACLESLGALTHPAHVLVLDNGSDDGSPASIARHFPDVEVIELGENLGYSRSVNIGIQKACDVGADYVLLLNNDVRVAPDMLDVLVHYAEHNPAYDMFSPLIYQLEHPERLWVVGGRWLLYSLVLEGWDTPDTGHYTTPTRFDILFATALLIRCSLVQHIGMFDEQFFAYYEDADLSLRARRAGSQGVVVPAARIWHAGSYSTRRRPHLREYHFARSRVYFYRKQLPGVHFLVFLLLQGWWDIQRVGLLLREGNPRSALAYAHGWLSGLFNR